MAMLQKCAKLLFICRKFLLPFQQMNLIEESKQSTKDFCKNLGGGRKKAEGINSVIIKRPADKIFAYKRLVACFSLESHSNT